MGLQAETNRFMVFPAVRGAVSAQSRWISPLLPHLGIRRSVPVASMEWVDWDFGKIGAIDYSGDSAKHQAAVL